MMAITHVAIAFAGTSIITGTVNAKVLLLAGIGSQIPDLDTTKSWVGAAFYPLARFVEERYPHRSITHSFFLSLAMATVTLPVLWLYGWQLWVAAPLGHLLSCFSDCFTKLGCQFFYPINKDIWVGGLNPKNRLETGKPGEYAVLASAVCTFCITFYIITGGGGIGKWATQTLFPTSQTAVQMLRQESQRAVRVRIVGKRDIDESQVDEQFWAIDAQGSTLIVQSTQGEILRVGEGGEIFPKRVEVKEGRKRIKVQRQRVEEAEGEVWAASLAPGALVTGTLEIEDATEIELPLLQPGVMATIKQSDSGINLNYASPADLQPIREFYILSGQVVIKEIL